MSKVKGGCLCGAVRYENSAEPKGAAVCHCTHCQKISGSAFSVNVIVPEDTMKITGGENLSNYTDTAESGRQLIRRFCKVCGSSLMSKSQSFPGMLVLKAGTLDDSTWVTPGVHIWSKSKQTWTSIPAGVTIFEKGRT